MKISLRYLTYDNNGKRTEIQNSKYNTTHVNSKNIYTHTHTYVCVHTRTHTYTQRCICVHVCVLAYVTYIFRKLEMQWLIVLPLRRGTEGWKSEER